MSMKQKIFYSALEMLLKWVMKKKGGTHYQSPPHYGKKPYYKKKRWFD
ncbi:hypothetical protein K4H28_14235 [Deefgea tanakiae]|uniref:Uncharacterized protein n=1 Tax=Deefgea tanakiae TaxID=2865840 RepID=A0ABX8Z4W4_9NEIS|nr:hypothetical protein [Deefgea tanakiae]QZA77425.1 hypothetical protein K4H28_14235 [Deefgea tanakiae]